MDHRKSAQVNNQVIRLYKSGKKTQREIAKITGISFQNVNSRLSRAGLIKSVPLNPDIGIQVVKLRSQNWKIKSIAFYLKIGLSKVCALLKEHGVETVNVKNLETAKRRKRVAALYLKGARPIEISTQLNLGYRSVTYDLRVIRRSLIKKTAGD